MHERVGTKVMLLYEIQDCADGSQQSTIKGHNNDRESYTVSQPPLAR
jgi:hypothetical protein